MFSLLPVGLVVIFGVVDLIVFVLEFFVVVFKFIFGDVMVFIFGGVTVFVFGVFSLSVEPASGNVDTQFVPSSLSLAPQVFGADGVVPPDGDAPVQLPFLGRLLPGHLQTPFTNEPPVQPSTSTGTPFMVPPDGAAGQLPFTAFALPVHVHTPLTTEPPLQLSTNTGVPVVVPAGIVGVVPDIFGDVVSVGVAGAGMQPPLGLGTSPCEHPRTHPLPSAPSV